MRKYYIITIFVLFCLHLGAEPQISGALLLIEKSKDYKEIGVREMVTGLIHPWGMTWLEDGKSILISERNGYLWIYNYNVDKVTMVKGLPKDVYKKGQGGFLDVAYHPNGWIYLSYARGNGNLSTTALVRFRLRFIENEYAVVESLQDVFEAQPRKRSTLHYGAPITISSNGTIFLGLGERGSFRHEAQNTGSHLGSIIHITATGEPAGGNPFSGSTGLPEIFSYGHRNVQGIFFDSQTNALYATEHGPKGGDEFNYIEAGKNYGWPVITYGKEYGSGKDIGEGVSKPGMEQPIKQWTPSPAFSGLTRYSGSIFPKWQGDFLVGALKYQRLYRLTLENNKIIDEEPLLLQRVGRIRSIRVDPSGYIYLLTDEKDGRLIRLERIKGRTDTE